MHNGEYLFRWGFQTTSRYYKKPRVDGLHFIINEEPSIYAPMKMNTLLRTNFSFFFQSPKSHSTWIYHFSSYFTKICTYFHSTIIKATSQICETSSDFKRKLKGRACNFAPSVHDTTQKQTYFIPNWKNPVSYLSQTNNLRFSNKYFYNSGNFIHQTYREF